MSVSIAIYGYDTDIGKIVIEVLDKSDIDIQNIYPLSPLNGEFDAINVKGKNYMIESVSDFDFSKVNIAFFLTTPDESFRLVPKAKESGCIIIDNSKLYVDDKNVPLVMPSINPYEIDKAIQTHLITPVSALTTQIILSLAPLHDEYGIDSVNMTAMLSVSEHGRLGTETLLNETVSLLNGRDIDESDFPSQVAFNVHCSIGSLDDNGYTTLENSIKNQLERVMGKFEKGMSLTCVQVPVFYGHTISFDVSLEENTSLDEIKELFNSNNEIKYIEDDVITPYSHGVNETCVVVSRLRQNSKKNFSFISIMDNSRRGEAITCVDIAKILSEKI